LTPPAPPGPEPEQRRARWLQATRIIASRYPPVDLFERVSPDKGVWDALIAAEMLVNPRIRNEVGEIHLVPPRERVSGRGATYVMAAFTHLNPRGSRFSDGSYGVYYAGREFETALRETAYHFARIAADSRDGTRYEDMRVLVSRIDARFHDLETLPRAMQKRLLEPDSYASSQSFGARLRDVGSNGLAYPSVRHHGGHCLAAFRPKVVGLPIQTNHLQYHYDGQRVVRYFDYGGSKWHPLEL
jgi:hypothetical protein